MKKTVKYVYIFISILFLIYLSIPNQKFPDPLEDSVQSFEPADVETPLRRGYYTDLSREEVMLHYKKQTNNSVIFGIKMPNYTLNYPPEEAQTLIRDQARSTFLEEIVHPFRESFFINGFEPKKDKDLILIDGKYWRQKVIVRHIPSNRIARVAIGLIVVMFVPLLYKGWGNFVVKTLCKRKK